MFLKFANFYRQFVRGVNQIAPPLTVILWTINRHLANKLISKKNNIYVVGGGKRIVEANRRDPEQNLLLPELS